MSGVCSIQQDIPAPPEEGKVPMVMVRPVRNGFVVRCHYAETSKDIERLDEFVFSDYDHLEAFLGNVLT